MKGYISYPRTSSTKYSPNFNIISHLKMFEKDYNSVFFGIVEEENGFKADKYVQELIKDFNIRNIDFFKKIDKYGHQPIIPTRYYNGDSFNYKRLELYNLISRHYFESLSPPLEYKTKEYIMKVGDYIFTGKSSEITDKGFLKFEPSKINEYTSEFPNLKINKKYLIVNYGIEEKLSEPPDFITEEELIDEMAAYNIGTNGTIPSHINNLSLRGYVKVDQKKRIIPTKLGIALINVLNKVEPDIIKPENRMKIEEFVKEIETGKKSYKEALDTAIKFYKNKFRDCSYRTDELRKEFVKYFNLKNMCSEKYKFRKKLEKEQRKRKERERKEREIKEREKREKEKREKEKREREEKEREIREEIERRKKRKGKN